MLCWDVLVQSGSGSIMKNLYFLHPIFPNISPPSSPLYCSLYSLTLGVGKPTLHMDDLPGGSNILEIKNIWSEANIFYISSANVDPSGCARNWKIGSTPQLAIGPGWWLTSALPGPAGQSKWSQFTHDLHHCKYLNIKWEENWTITHNRWQLQSSPCLLVYRTRWWLPLIHNSMERDTKSQLCKS